MEELLPPDGPPTTFVFRNGTSTAVAIAAGSLADRARSRLDLRAFIDDLGNVIVGYEDRWMIGGWWSLLWILDEVL